MGLDSVEFIQNLEVYFGPISDREAAQLYRVEEVVNYLVRRNAFSEDQSPVELALLQKLQIAFSQTFPHRQNSMGSEEALGVYFRSETAHDQWQQVVWFLGMEMPHLDRVPLRQLSSWRAIFRPVTKDRIPLDAHTLNDLVHWLMALHFKTLLPREKMSCALEVKAVVFGMIHHGFGIPVDEIRLRHRLADDFGVD
ncbi:MAG: hypothetical protein ACFB10_15585 [Salibacteraceae bacterium]